VTGSTHKMISVPNAMTVIRIVMALVAGWMFAGGTSVHVAAGLCLFASLLDWLDGWYARRFGQVTALGAHLDPAADKILFGVVFGALALSFRWQWFTFLVSVMIAREIAVTVYRSIRRRRTGRYLPASRFGKVKTMTQCLVGNGLLFWVFVYPGAAPERTWVVLVMMLFTTVLTVDSGLRYLLPSCADGKKRSVTERIAQALFGVKARGS